MSPESVGGVVLETSQGPMFVPAEIAERVASVSGVAPVPGLVAPALGIALADGQVVTVLGVGRGPSAGPRQVLVCNLSGERVALSGGTVLATGLFERGPNGGARFADAEAPPLDVRALYARAEAAVWAARAELRERRRVAEDER